MTKKENTFKPFCGFDFDPSKSGDCFEICKIDNPDEFKKCLENFEKAPAPVKAKTISRTTKGKSCWGHLAGSQAGLIDELLKNSAEPLSLDEISESVGGRPPRVLHHIKHLEKDLNLDVRATSEKGIYVILGIPHPDNKDKSVSGHSVKTLTTTKK